LIANAPDDSLAAVAQCSVKVLLSNKLMAHNSMNLSQQTAQKYPAKTTNVNCTTVNNFIKEAYCKIMLVSG